MTFPLPGGESPEPRLRVQCAFCPSDGEVCNPANGDPAVKITNWLPPLICPRCGGTGKDPNP